MEQLINKMNRLLASSFTMYLKAHSFHWNVTGQDFFQYHDFFGELYTELWGAIDTTAEQIRALNGHAHGSLTYYKENSAVPDQMTVPSIQEMVGILSRDNDTVLGVLNEVHEEATKNNQYGLINYIEGRIDTHKKHGWMLRSSRITSPVAVTQENNAPQAQTKNELVEEVKTYFLQFNKNK